jgi:predicted peptidase
VRVGLRPLRSACVVVACLQSGLAPALAQQSVASRMQAHTFGTTPYRLFVPAGYRADRAYPLVLFLHGGGGRGTDNVAQLGEGNGLLVELFLERQDSFPAFVVAPQTNTSHDVPATLRIVDLLQKQYRIDAQRVYVLGQSLGGIAAVETIEARPRMFAAAVIIAAAMPTHFARDLAGVPLWFLHGELDSVFPVEHVRALAEAVRKAGGSASVTEYAGEGHGLAWLVAREKGIVPWLFAHKR